MTACRGLVTTVTRAFECARGRVFWLLGRVDSIFQFHLHIFVLLLRGRLRLWLRRRRLHWWCRLLQAVLFMSREYS